LGLLSLLGAMTTRILQRYNCSLVTGASAGIGAGFARVLASEGSDLVLVARDKAKLETLAKELRKDHGIEVDVLPADLATSKGIAAVEARLTAEPAIDLFVNNAGVGSNGSFADLPLEGELRQIDVNVTAVARLMHTALGPMLAADSGTIINVSSVMCFKGVPGSAMYTATKAFITTLADAVHEETRETGVTLTTLLPGSVRTEFHDRAGMNEAVKDLPDAMWLMPDDVAREALKAARKGKAMCIPTAKYKMFGTVMRLAPYKVFRRIGGRNYRKTLAATADK
jgi:short-subunit dehydrogenase